jgi:hypothetical protein
VGVSFFFFVIDFISFFTGIPVVSTIAGVQNNIYFPALVLKMEFFA